MRARLLTLVAIGATVLCWRPALTQDARPGVFGEMLDVRVVNVEVVVTDSHGTRVADLKPGDFELRVDGKPVAIDYFAEVVGGRARETAPGGGAPAPPAVTAAGPLGVSWLVFIDDYFSIARDRDRVLDNLAAQVALLGPADRMAVVAWDGRRLTMLTSWTESPRALQRAIEEAKRRPAFGLQRIAERRSLQRDLQARPTIPGLRTFPGDPYHLEPDERHLIDLVASQVQRSTNGAAATLRAFAAPPGRKAMLLLAGGWPWRPVDTVAPDRQLLTEDTPGGERLYRPLTDVANLLGYTLYTVDVPGLSEHLVDASQMAPIPNAALRESIREQDLHASLDWMASTTGGRAFLNGGRGTLLEDAVTDTRTFYWLGFTPQRTGDDRRHEIVVKVKRPGLRVRSRQGYLDLSRRAEVSMAVESALLFGNPASAAPLALTLGAPQKAGRGTMKVPLAFKIPLDQLTALPGAHGSVASLELRVAAQDDSGDMATPAPMVLAVDVPANRHAGDSGHFSTLLVLRRAPQDLVVALYEPVSGKIFSATARVSP